jgi:hypothetical protein
MRTEGCAIENFQGRHRQSNPGPPFLWRHRWLQNVTCASCITSVAAGLFADIMPETKCKPVILTSVVLTYGNQFMLVICANCIYTGKVK